MDQQGRMGATVILYVSGTVRDRNVGRKFDHMHARELRLRSARESVHSG